MRKHALVALSLMMLAGCGQNALAPSNLNLSSDFIASAYQQIGGKAYANFKINPELPKGKDNRKAVKLTYLCTDDTGHQSPWSQKMLQMMDDLPQSGVHNVVFRDGGEHGDSRMYYIQQADGSATTVRNPQSTLAKGVGEVQSNNPKVFSQILGWTLDNYPGRRKYLQIYTHGAGVFGVGCDEKQTDLSGNTLPEEQNIGAMPVWAFGEALRQGLKGRQLDAIYFRACLMGSVEALYELRGTTRYALASEDVSYSVDNTNLWMTKSFDDMANADLEPAAIAKQLAIQAHAKHPQGKDDTFYGYTTFAAVDISRMDELKTAINGLSASLIKGMQNDQDAKAILAAYNAVPSVQGEPEQDEYSEQMRDLWAFTAQLLQKSKNSTILSAVDRVRRAQETAMLHEKDCFGSAANGLSILMPSTKEISKYAKFIDGTYQKTKFAKDSNWDDFLREIAKSN